MSARWSLKLTRPICAGACYGISAANSIVRAAGLFERAISIDPNYAPAYAGLVDCYAVLSATTMGAASPAEMIPKAKAAARRALELDPQLAEAHASLGCVELFFDWD